MRERYREISGFKGKENVRKCVEGKEDCNKVRENEGKGRREKNNRERRREKKKGGIEERMLRLKIDGKDMRELIDWIIKNIGESEIGMIEVDKEESIKKKKI